MIADYKTIVRDIKLLPWENLSESDLCNLMHLSCASAYEFAEALRIALRLYPNDADLQEMAAGELNTSNLSFSSYDLSADHSHFLDYFIAKCNAPVSSIAVKAAEKYRSYCANLSDEIRAMTIFSREEELFGIFERILTAKCWSHPGLAAFQYYLRRHIELDSEPGGHYDLTRRHHITNDVSGFYSARMEMYQSIAPFAKNPAPRACLSAV